MPHLDQQARIDAFTAVVCRAHACEQAGDLELIDSLRATIRRCPFGVLVVSGCALGPLTCRSRCRGGDSGAIVVVQPCWNDRRPAGGAIWVGPLETADDTRSLCRWLEQGDLRPATLPRNLRYARRLAQRTSAN